MRFHSILLASLASAVATSADYVRCGMDAPPREQMQALNRAAERSSASNARILGPRSIDTYVHVVTTQAQEGRFTQAMIDEQMRIMNDAFRILGRSFRTVSTTYTVNDTWASAGARTVAEREMKQNLRQGSYADLNLYFLSNLGNNLLGFCYFPVANPTAEQLILDGCINLAASLPGGGARNYELGHTAVHETGHWFGLYHVFQQQARPCWDLGDYVKDTPPQANATRGCPERQDSCPFLPGLDSINNYMDYSFDACMNQFTRGQATRATVLYNLYRAGR